jgi:hypothetical protein
MRPRASIAWVGAALAGALGVNVVFSAKVDSPTSAQSEVGVAKHTCGPGNPDIVRAGYLSGGETPGSVSGRPLRVEGETRLAPIAARRDWLVSDLAPNMHTLDAGVRAELAAAWLANAQMEHASVAAFARFALDLLALGAPSDLVAQAQEAMGDEVRHARASYALASAYRGRELGPGPLDVRGAVGAPNPLDFAVALVHEGCIGETLSAVEAAEASSLAKDSAVRRALGAIAAEEARHAALAWRALGWILDREGPDLRFTIESVFAAALANALHAAPARRSAHDAALVAHGILDARTSHALRRCALQQLIAPAARGLGLDLARPARQHAATHAPA